MGKKGSWFTALKKAFTSNSKDKPTNVQHLAQEPYHKSTKEKKKWGFRRSKQHSESAPSSFLPLHREPSSIEKILGDAERERHHYSKAHQTTHKKPLQLPPPPPPPTAAAAATIRRTDHGREQQQQPQLQQQPQQQPQLQLQNRTYVQKMQPKTPTPEAKKARAPRPKITPSQAHISAVRIQSAFRGYMARRNYRALRGLIRLQGVMRGHSVMRQTAHAMKCMQMLTRVQSHVRARRVEATERRKSLQHEAALRGDAEAGGVGWGVGHQDGRWNDSALTREEVDARTKRKVQAVIKRERALAYAYSHQLLKPTPTAAHAILADLRSGRSLWWWSPIQHHNSEAHHLQPNYLKPVPATSNLETATTRSVFSSSSTKLKAARPIKDPSPSYHSAIWDDESLTSCPPLVVPNYMTPTVSASAKAKAKAKAKTRAHDRQPEQKPRFSFGLGQSIGSWAKSPFWKDSRRSSRVGTPTTVAGRHRSAQSVSGLSVDSTVSLPVGLGRRAFK